MRKTAAFLLFLLLANGAAIAQTKAPPAQSPQSCARQGEEQGGGKFGKPLSDQLSDSKGVICPPPTQDSGATVPPPETGMKMPVIKPPASAK